MTRHCKEGVIFTLLITLLIGGCANPIQYDSDYESTIDFGTYHSFAWHTFNEFTDKTNVYIANDMTDKRIRSAVDSELITKGFSKSAHEKASFWVNYTIITEDKVDIRTYNTYNGLAPGWRYTRSTPYGYGFYGIGYRPIVTDVETETTHYTVGTLVLDIIHPDSGELVWRGTAKGKLKRNKLTPTEKEQLINEIIKNILVEFPPTKAT